jgi:FkbM family methyltransferase
VILVGGVVLMGTLINSQSPKPLQVVLINALGALFRRYISRGRGFLLNLLFPNGAFFDYDFTITAYEQPYAGNLKFGIDNFAFFFQAFEAYNINLLREIAIFLTKEKLRVDFLDIGANVGSHSHFLIGYVNEIHSFEPHPEIFKSLSAKHKIAQSPNFHIHQFGLGAENCQLEYYEPSTNNTGTGSFIVGGSSINQESPILLPIRRGDEVMAEIGVCSVSLIKIDVEGFEPFVLQGLAETLKRDRPIILMEMSTIARRVMQENDLRLESLLYEDAVLLEIKPIGRKGKFHLEPKEFKTLSPEHHDLLVIPREHSDDLLSQLLNGSVQSKCEIHNAPAQHWRK